MVTGQLAVAPCVVLDRLYCGRPQLQLLAALWTKQAAGSSESARSVTASTSNLSLADWTGVRVCIAEDGMSLRRMAELLPPLENDTEVAAPLVARKVQGVPSLCFVLSCKP